MTPRVFLVDDQPAILKALSRLLASAGYTVQGYTSAQAFLASGDAGTPGCLVLDLAMPDMGGMALQQELGRRNRHLPVIFLTGQGDIATGVQAMKLGAADFLTKPVDDERLLAAVAAAFERNQRSLAESAERDDIRQRLATLTPREREVMDLVAEGLLNKQIASVLGTVEKTVKVHRARVMAKMQAKSVSALVRMVDRLRNEPES
jgi:RNA polymerase sigma factor (sigma-70 family)